MSSPSVEPAELVNDVDRIVKEMQRSVREALARHRAAGNSVAVWRDGRVCWIPPEEIPVTEAPPAAT